MDNKYEVLISELKAELEAKLEKLALLQKQDRDLAEERQKIKEQIEDLEIELHEILKNINSLTESYKVGIVTSMLSVFRKEPEKDNKNNQTLKGYQEEQIKLEHERSMQQERLNTNKSKAIGVQREIRSIYYTDIPELEEKIKLVIQRLYILRQELEPFTVESANEAYALEETPIYRK